MFKILIIQSLYNLSDDAIEFQILDRLSLMRFLNLSLGDRVPDSKAIWLFRDQLTKANLIGKLFAEFDGFLKNNGYTAKKGPIVHASNVFEELLDDANSSRDVYADSDYRSKDLMKYLEQKGYREHLQRKGNRHKKLTEWEKQGNRIRSRVEHIFGIQAMTAGNLILRTIGLARAKAKIGLRNLAYNMNRYKTLVRNGV